jgi:lipoprotein-anchoring transpeptidase ErfK/SrfK
MLRSGDERPGHRSGTRLLGVSALVLSLFAVSACSDAADAATVKRSLTVLSNGRPVKPDVGPPALAVAPGADANAVSVTDPVTVNATNATLDSVTLTAPDGKRIAGEVAPDKHGWRSTEPLGYNKKYSIKVVGTGVNGQHVEQGQSFTTVKPANLTMPYLRANANLLLADRQSFGVGQIIVVGFDEKIPDKAAAERNLEVVTDPPVKGGWHWSGKDEVQWRPENYWAPGTKVTVKADVYGKNLGNGLYGQQDVSTSFTIGQSKIATADDNTHHIKVAVDGQEVRDVPTAMGKNVQTRGANGQSVDFRTRSGVHVVLGNERNTHMTSASFGVTTGPNAYDENIEWTTHISYQGEYVHAAPWSVGQQGHSNASHGCLNVNTENAIWFYNNFGPGDVVNVLNTGISLDPGDGLTGWNMSWADWVAGSALPH